MSNPEAWDCGRANNESDGGQTDKLENYLRVKLRNGCFEDKVNMTGRFLALGWIMSIPEKGHIKRKNRMGAGGGRMVFLVILSLSCLLEGCLCANSQQTI